MNIMVAGGHESFEEWVRSGRLALELGMELARHKKWVIADFDNLDQLAIG